MQMLLAELPIQMIRYIGMQVFSGQEIYLETVINHFYITQTRIPQSWGPCWGLLAPRVKAQTTIKTVGTSHWSFSKEHNGE